MGKVIFYTPAYNSEKTLRRTVDSVLAQTHADFIYYLLDNASTDGTREIVNEYGMQDKRIIPLHNEVNWIGNWILELIENHSDDSYLCALDADDEYAPDYLEKMLAFMLEHNLEVAACGNDFIDARTNNLASVRKLGQNLILEGDGFNEHFPQYHQFMRTIWGKVYSLSILRKPDYINYVIPGYGSDTLFAMKAFYNANRVGIFAESLYKYYMYPKSASRQFDEKRIASDQILFDAGRDFLISKCGTVSHENLDFLFHIYFYAIEDTLKVLINAQLSVTDKLYKLKEVFQDQHTQEFVQWPGATELKNEMFGQVAKWMLSQKEVRSGTGLETAADILAAMDLYPSQIKGWQDCMVFILLTKIKDRLKEKRSLDNIDAQIISVTSKSSMLAGLDSGFLMFFREIVFSILQLDEKKALRRIEDEIAQETEIPDEYIEAFLALGLKLSIKLEYTSDFIYIKKLQILHLIDLCRTDEARDELADWDVVLPSDKDFKELRVRLTQ